jgi:hypothetical protein
MNMNAQEAGGAIEYQFLQGLYPTPSAQVGFQATPYRLSRQDAYFADSR